MILLAGKSCVDKERKKEKEGGEKHELHGRALACVGDNTA